ncbi:MAG: ATP-binding cassette domain-containing protein [Deltaproteobacteria bacterium]|nr:ATP-binding cassette domain-containing protein [Deltaproteobacteria bacterium]
MIEVEGLTKYYGNYHALKGVTFSVRKGEILGFLGPNGAGKTTTMRILTCFFPPTSGKAKVAGFDVFEEPLEVRKRIGYLPENVPLYKDMTVEDYLNFAAGIKGVEGKKVKVAVAKAMDECVLTDVSYKFISELSKGYRQRVGLAQALVNDPEVLILDEPTIGLDPKQIIEIRKLIKNLAGRRTVILSTHILPEVSMTCQRVVIINDGRVVAVDTASASGVGEYIVEAIKGRDIRKEIAPCIVNKGWALLELKPQEMSLEDIFVKLVTKE